MLNSKQYAATLVQLFMAFLFAGLNPLAKPFLNTGTDCDKCFFGFPVTVAVAIAGWFLTQGQ